MPAKPSALIVDDDLEFLAVTTEQLRPVCQAVFVARAPLTALWVLEREAVDVVLCDLRLGHTDGRHLLSRIRAGWPHVARVLVTGYSDDLTRRESFPAAQAVLIKPVDGDGLADLVRRLGNQPATRLREVDLADIARARLGSQPAPTTDDPGGDWGADDTDPGDDG